MIIMFMKLCGFLHDIQNFPTKWVVFTNNNMLIHVFLHRGNATVVSLSLKHQHDSKASAPFRHFDASYHHIISKTQK